MSGRRLPQRRGGVRFWPCNRRGTVRAAAHRGRDTPALTRVCAAARAERTLGTRACPGLKDLHASGVSPNREHPTRVARRVRGPLRRAGGFVCVSQAVVTCVARGEKARGHTPRPTGTGPRARPKSQNTPTRTLQQAERTTSNPPSQRVRPSAAALNRGYKLAQAGSCNW